MSDSEMAAPRRRSWKRAPLEIVAAFRCHECLFLAAGISFYFMLSLVPMLFLTLAVIGHFLRGSTVREDLLNAVHAYIPFLTNEIIKNIDQVVRNPGLLGWIGGAALFLSTDLVFVAVQSSLDKIFAPGRRSFLKSKMSAVFLAVMVFCVLMATIAVNAVDRSVTEIEALASAAGWPRGWPVGLHLSTWTIALLMLGCATFAIRVLPHVDVPFRYALSGAIVATGFWLLVKAYYVGYLENISKVGPLFGSLSAVILTLVWVYMSALVFLVGAEVTRWLVVTDPRRSAEPSGEGASGISSH
jgi:membrane protein